MCTVCHGLFQLCSSSWCYCNSVIVALLRHLLYLFCLRNVLLPVALTSLHRMCGFSESEETVVKVSFKNLKAFPSIKYHLKNTHHYKLKFKVKQYNEVHITKIFFKTKYSQITQNIKGVQEDLFCVTG